MSKHLSETERAGYLINAVTKGQGNIEVQKVEEGGNVILKADDKSAGFLQSILSAPKRLAEYVYRAIVRPGKNEEVEEKEEVEEESLELDEQDSSEEVIELDISNTKTKQKRDAVTVMNIEDEDMLEEVFTERMVSDFSVDEFSSSGFGCVKKLSNSPSGFWAKRQFSNYELIQLALSDPKQIANILLGRATKIDSENDIEAEDLSEYAANIFSVTRNGKQVTSVFNVAAFKQMLLVHLKCNLSEYSPIVSKIISGKHKGLYSINLEHLKVYIGKQVAELVFNPEVGKDNKLVLKPVMIPSIKSNEEESQSTDSVHVKLLLDVSSSMGGHMATYIKKVKSVVTKIVQSAECWQIDLTSFNTTSTTSSFNSDKDSLESIIKFIDDLESRGCTKLYGTMHEELTEMSENSAKFSHSVFIVFTDGEDNESGYVDESDVISSALTVRGKVSNLQMFSMELGDSNESFFKNIGVESGFTHIQLGKIEDLGKFEQYVKGLLKNTVVLKLLNESFKVWARQVAVEDEITVGNVVVKPNTVLNFGDVTYTISNPSEGFSDLLGDNDSLESSE